MDMLADPQYRTADGSALRMWRDSAPNKFLSEQEGRAIFDEVIFCEVISPGSRDSSPVFELRRTFAPEMNHPAPLFGPKYEEYASFVKDFETQESGERDAALAGTPLRQWPELPITLIATLKVAGIFTVDALANLPDSKLAVVGPDGRTWREKAKAYIEVAANVGAVTKYASENEVLRNENTELKSQVSTLAEQVAALQSSSKKAATTAKAADTATLVADPGKSII